MSRDHPATVEPFQFSPAEPVAYEGSCGFQFVKIRSENETYIEGPRVDRPYTEWQATSIQRPVTTNTNNRQGTKAEVLNESDRTFNFIG